MKRHILSSLLCGLMLTNLILGAEEQAQPLSLEQSIEFALEHSPFLAAAHHEFGAARAQLRQAQARKWFSIEAQASHTRQGPSVSLVGRPVFQKFRNDVRVLLQQPLYSDFLNASERFAELNAQAARYDYEQAKQQLIYNVTLAYLDVLRAQQLEEVANKSLALSEERLRIAQTMFEAGSAPEFHVRRAKTQLAAAQERLVIAQNAVALAKTAFNNVLGRPTDAPVVLEPVVHEVFSPPSLEESIKLAFAQRPELLSLQKQIKAAGAAIHMAKAGDKPSLDFNVGINRQVRTGLFPGFIWQATVIVNMPLWDSGLSRHEADEAAHRRKALKSTYEQVRQRVELEVRQALLNMEEARLRIETTTEEVKEAEEALRIANLRYEARLDPIVEVLDAETALTQARTNHVHALYDYRLAWAEWQRAVGEIGSQAVRQSGSQAQNTNHASRIANHEKGETKR